jgi:hypothetical protein
MGIFSYRNLALVWTGVAGVAAVGASTLQVTYAPPAPVPVAAMTPAAAPIAPAPPPARPAPPHRVRQAEALPVPPVPPRRYAAKPAPRQAELAYAVPQPVYQDWGPRERYMGQYAAVRPYWYQARPAYGWQPDY